MAGGIQFLPAPPSGAESTVSPILMYLLHPSPLAFHSACRSCLHLYRITRASSLESSGRKRDGESEGEGREEGGRPETQTQWSPCLPTVALLHRPRDEPGQDRGQPCFPKAEDPADSWRFFRILTGDADVGPFSRDASHNLRPVIYASPFFKVNAPRVNA